MKRGIPVKLSAPMLPSMIPRMMEIKPFAMFPFDMLMTAESPKSASAKKADASSISEIYRSEQETARIPPKKLPKQPPVSE